MHKEYVLTKLANVLNLEAERDLSKVREEGKLIAQRRNSFMEGFKSRGLPLVAAGISLMGIYFAVDQIMDYLQQKGKAVKSKEYFQTMMKAHPQLQKEDPKVVAQYWESLYHFAPDMAEDPLAAGAWITQSVRKLSGQELGGPSPDSYATLTQINKSMKDANQDGSIKSREFILPEMSKGLMNIGVFGK